MHLEIDSNITLCDVCNVTTSQTCVLSTQGKCSHVVRDMQASDCTVANGVASLAELLLAWTNGYCTLHVAAAVSSSAAPYLNPSLGQSGYPSFSKAVREYTWDIQTHQGGPELRLAPKVSVSTT